ncbi:MAG TPA: precorrin-8X methylmutase [Chloroflexota bacterium]|nr:precorrin-8X methylmutase [Chloroflexota bacterium]
MDAVIGDLSRWPPAERAIIRRVVYASGDPALAERVRVHPEAIAGGIAALRAGCPIVVDVRMLEVALDRGSLRRLGCRVACAIDRESVTRKAHALGLPRAVVAMRTLAASMNGGVVSVGTAPTALLAVLDLVDAGAVRPALIVGTPVGFVAAAEAKAELVSRPVPFITIEGERGGAALAATLVNELLRRAIFHDEE